MGGGTDDATADDADTAAAEAAREEAEVQEAIAYLSRFAAAPHVRELVDTLTRWFELSAGCTMVAANPPALGGAVPAHLDAVWGRVPKLIGYGLLSYHDDDSHAAAAEAIEGGGGHGTGTGGSSSSSSRATYVDNGIAGRGVYREGSAVASARGVYHSDSGLAAWRGTGILASEADGVAI